MPSYFTISAPIKSFNGKTFWHKIGTAICKEGKDNIACSITSIPLNWDGQFFLFPDHAAERRARKWDMEEKDEIEDVPF